LITDTEIVTSLRHTIDREAFASTECFTGSWLVQCCRSRPVTVGELGASWVLQTSGITVRGGWRRRWRRDDARALVNCYGAHPVSWGAVVADEVPPDGIARTTRGAGVALCLAATDFGGVFPDGLSEVATDLTSSAAIGAIVSESGRASVVVLLLFPLLVGWCSKVCCCSHGSSKILSTSVGSSALDISVGVVGPDTTISINLCDVGKGCVPD